jgi:SAM-dependent methyltransferase
VGSEMCFRDRACPVCAGQSFEDVALLRDNRIRNSAQRFRVARCARCGLLGLRPSPSEKDLLAAYEEEYLADPASDGSPMPVQPRTLNRMSAVWDRTRHVWHIIDGNVTIDRIPVHGRVLDVGVGYGYSVAYLRRQGHDVLGIEPSVRAVASCQARGLPVVRGMLETIDIPPGSFDTVILSQVIEHLPNPEASLRAVFQALRPRGHLCILTPNADGVLRWAFGDEWAHWHVPFHVYLYGRTQLRRLLEANGFRVAHLSTLTPAIWVNISMQMRRYRSQQTGWMLSKEMRDWQPHLATRLAIAPLFRAVDLFDQGDCLRVVAVKR